MVVDGTGCSYSWRSCSPRGPMRGIWGREWTIGRDWLNKNYRTPAAFFLFPVGSRSSDTSVCYGHQTSGSHDKETHLYYSSRFFVETRECSTHLFPHTKPWTLKVPFSPTRSRIHSFSSFYAASKLNIHHVVRMRSSKSRDDGRCRTRTLPPSQLLDWLQLEFASYRLKQKHGQNVTCKPLTLVTLAANMQQCVL